MSDELLETYTRQLIESHRIPEVTVAWQGGEPALMGLDFFRRSLEYQQKYLKPGMTILNTIQTNGTLLDDEWAAFFKENNFLVGISVDGPQEMHDLYRKDKSGKGTFNRVMRGLEVLQKHEVEYNTLTTLNRQNADHPLEEYRFLRDECKAAFIQFIPIVERVKSETDLGHQAEQDTKTPVQTEHIRRRSWRERPLYIQEGDLASEHSVTAKQYGQFLIGVFEEWVRKDVGKVYVQMFDVALASWYGEPSGLCIHSKTCGNALALEHNGDLYACDHFVEPKYLLGNISERLMIELVASPKQRKFGQDKLDALPKYCLDCQVRFACHGGCPKDRFIHTPQGDPGLNYLCEGYNSFFQHIDQPMRIMSDLLRRNLAPRDIMLWYAKKDAERGSAAQPEKSPRKRGHRRGGKKAQ